MRVVTAGVRPLYGPYRRGRPLPLAQPHHGGFTKTQVCVPAVQWKRITQLRYSDAWLAGGARCCSHATSSALRSCEYPLSPRRLHCACSSRTEVTSNGAALNPGSVSRVSSASSRCGSASAAVTEPRQNTEDTISSTARAVEFEVIQCRNSAELAVTLGLTEGERGIGVYTHQPPPRLGGGMRVEPRRPHHRRHLFRRPARGGPHLPQRCVARLRELHALCPHVLQDGGGASGLSRAGARGQ